MNENLGEFQDESGMKRRWFLGSCHCGGVQFSVAATLDITVTLCNCSICYRSGHQEIMVREDHFILHQGEELLSSYRFGENRAEHTFCSRCGIKPFYRPRSHPRGFRSVNARCLTFAPDVTLTYADFDGQNWESSIAAGLHRLTD